MEKVRSDNLDAPGNQSPDPLNKSTIIPPALAQIKTLGLDCTNLQLSYTGLSTPLNCCKKWQFRTCRSLNCVLNQRQEPSHRHLHIAMGSCNHLLQDVGLCS